MEQVRPALHRSVWMSLRDLSTLTVRCGAGDSERSRCNYAENGVGVHYVCLLSTVEASQKQRVEAEGAALQDCALPLVEGTTTAVASSRRQYHAPRCRRIYEKLAAQRCSPLTTAKLLKGSSLAVAVHTATFPALRNT